LTGNPGACAIAAEVDLAEDEIEPMTSLKILSGGAAQGLVGKLAPLFKTKTGFEVHGSFGAVGTMADKLRAGEPADLVILTQALVAKLGEEGLVSIATAKDVGVVETALAVRTRDATISVPDQASLRAALLASDAIHVPDTKSSTAGIHIAKILAHLGIALEVEGRLKVYPNGAAAMRHLAESKAQRPIGCTQSTEIISTPGVMLSGTLPPNCELATTYTVAAVAKASHSREARALIDLLIAPDHRELRALAGFVEHSSR
jgi:molybdate transport system substrate-binding protein